LGGKQEEKRGGIHSKKAPKRGRVETGKKGGLVEADGSARAAMKGGTLTIGCREPTVIRGGSGCSGGMGQNGGWSKGGKLMFSM